MPARCLRDGSYGSCNRLRAPLRRNSKNSTHFESAVARPFKDRLGPGLETVLKPSKAVKENASVPMTAIPDPVPENNHRKTAPVSSWHATSTASTSTSPVSSASSVQVPQTVAFRPLPPLLSILPPRTGFVYTATPSLATPSIPERTSSVGAAKLSGSHRLAVPVIAIAVVSSAAFLLALIFAIKICLRPSRRIHPTPSRPILADTPSDSDLKVDGSPLFGCDGRQSLPGVWTWTQYAQPTAKSAPNPGQDPPTEFESYDDDDKKLDQASTYNLPGPQGGLLAQGNGTIVTPANSLQHVSMALTRAASRMSAASISLYANHIVKDAQMVKNTPLTADGHPALERSTSNPSRGVAGPPVRKEETRDIRSSQGLAYDGADILSPQVWLPSLAMNKSTLALPPVASSGRSRIKSTYYTAHGYPRISAAPPSVAVPSAKVNTPGAKPSSMHRPSRKAESRRVRDTRALTSALGIDFPPMPSPQLTLYPDDSLSVISDGNSPSHGADGGEDVRDRTRKEQIPPVSRNSRTFEPGLLHSRGDTTTALGNLMLMDYSSTFKSLASIPGQDSTTPPQIPLPVQPLAVLNNTKTYLSLDKPPRVPSPPLLPSLAQMALAHENPESFANYRSPTYSIYGLYESERKSRAVSAFGY